MIFHMKFGKGQFIPALKYIKQQQVWMQGLAAFNDFIAPDLGTTSHFILKLTSRCWLSILRHYWYAIFAQWLSIQKNPWYWYNYCFFV